MTNNSRGQRLPSSSQQSRKNSAWGVIVGIALLGVFLSASAQAAKFKANSPADPPARDAKPGDLFSAPFYNHRLSLFLTGSGASVSIIDGNKSLHSNSGVLSIGLTLNSEITVSISRVTIRNGSAGEDGGDLCAGL